jgi:AhpC/TSA family
MPNWVLTACLLVTASLLFGDRSIAQDSRFGIDLNGKPVERLAGQDTKGIVLVFLASDCAISNRYLPEIKRLQKEFAPRGVMFWLVYPNAGETAEALLQHLKAYRVDANTVLDPQHNLVSLAQAKVTPEAAVLVKTGETQSWLDLSTTYHGRIDNRYVEIGKERPSATEHDLEQAVNATLAHRPPTPPGGPAVGCGITGP